ncbi:MAG: GTPase Era [Candidatus Omnitrophica bacterium]|nr:GTPase Era [Candidatus Omnitrophota bacterium]
MEKTKCGFVAILGRPNVGKSTLLNSLIGKKISIVSNIPQTTRYKIKGILNLKEGQIVFIDTPGLHEFSDNLTKHLNTVAKQSIEDCDLILYVVDTSRSFGKEEQKIMDFLTQQEIKVIMVLNKIDLSKKFINDYIENWKFTVEKNCQGKDPLIYFLPISATRRKNLDILVKLILENLPIQEPFYDNQTITDFPLKFKIADVIREKLFLKLKKEIPHSLAVEVEEIEEKENVTLIKVKIYVSRNSQKKIVIGKGGAFIKEVGMLSRQELESILGKKIYLELKVKVLGDWQDKPRLLQELGYWIA